MRYFIQLSGLTLLGLLSVNSQSNMAIAQVSKPTVMPTASPRDTKKAEADRLTIKGNQQIQNSQYELAKQTFTQALKLYREIGDRNGEANSLMNLGVAHRSLSQDEQAIGYYQQALPLFQQVKDLRGEAAALMNMGNMYESSQADKAIELFQKALLISKQLKDLNSEAMILGNMGIVYGSLSQYDKALDAFHQALPLFRQVRDRDGEKSLLRNIGYAFLLQEQPESAIAFYKQSVKLAELIRYDLRKQPQDSQRAYAQSLSKYYTTLAKLLTQEGQQAEAQTILALLKQIPPSNVDAVKLTAAEQKILAEFSR
jgi:tetratricopeptide (TPR) repeat protein